MVTGFFVGGAGGIRTHVWQYHKLISSQPRYDRFDTAPYIFSSEGSSNFKKVLERTDGENYKNFQIRTHEKLRKNKENADTKRTVCGGISSRSRYDPFDTAPYIFSSDGSSKIKKVLERTDGENYKNIQIRTHEKLRKNKENADTKRTVCGGISSQPRYDRFDTAPLEFCGIISAIRKKIKDFRKKSIPVLKKQRLPNQV